MHAHYNIQLSLIIFQLFSAYSFHLLLSSQSTRTISPEVCSAFSSYSVHQDRLRDSSIVVVVVATSWLVFDAIQPRFRLTHVHGRCGWRDARRSWFCERIHTDFFIHPCNPSLQGKKKTSRVQVSMKGPSPTIFQHDLAPSESRGVADMSPLL
jgi:hypothetical protein